jgi:REP element-mobilizing transposase RayT
MGPSGSDPEAGGELLRGLAEHHAFENEETKIAVDRVHTLLGFPPRYSIANITNVVKGARADRVFCKCVKVGKDLREGRFRESGYCARTIRNGVAAKKITGTFGAMKAGKSHG